MRKTFLGNSNFSDISCTHRRMCVYGRYAPGISQQQYREAVNNGGTINISKFHLSPRNFRTSAWKFWLNGLQPLSRLNIPLLNSVCVFNLKMRVTARVE